MHQGGNKDANDRKPNRPIYGNQKSDSSNIAGQTNLRQRQSIQSKHMGHRSLSQTVSQIQAFFEP